MRFYTRAQLFGVLAALAFTTTTVYLIHQARAQEEFETASARFVDDGKTPPNHLAENEESDRLLQFLRLMEEETTFDFFETPLDEFTVEIAERHNVNVILDKKAIEDLAIDADEPITMEISGVSLGTALDTVLPQHDLDYGFQENVVIISTVDALGTQLQTRVYNVRDMLNAKQPWRSLDKLMEVITGSVQSNSWEELGGDGTIHAYQGNLVVSQTWRQHREVSRLLTVLRKNIQAMGGPKMPLPPSGDANAQDNSSSGGFGGGGFGGGGFGGGGFGGGGFGGGGLGGRRGGDR